MSNDGSGEETMNINWESTFHLHPKTLEPGTKGIPIPSYGLYGGPGISGPGEPLDELDAAFETHDNLSALAGNNVALQSAADAQLVFEIAALDQQGLLDDPEEALYAGVATLGIVGELALNDSLQLLGSQAQLAAILVNAVDNIETGLTAEPSEGRGLHGALHLFEAKFADFLLV
jgi:hypothetical protein